MSWETSKEYENRSSLWDDMRPSAATEALDDDKIAIFRDWLLRRRGLTLHRRIASFEVYEFESRGGLSDAICRRSERFMLKLTPKVVRGWNGEWEVMDPVRTLGIRADRSWSVLVERLAPDSSRDPVSFRLIRSDNKDGMPFSPLTLQPQPAQIVKIDHLDRARRARFVA